MSSTNRGGKRSEADFYATPGWVTRAILPHVPIDGLVLCGDGAMMHELVLAGAGRVVGVEIDAGRAHTAAARVSAVVHHADFLSAPVALRFGPWDLIITNPPFSLAQRFVERALADVRVGGTVAMLLRLAFLERQARAPFHRAHPSDVYVLPKRPSFSADGATDSSAYAWFVWGPGRGGRWQILDVDGEGRKR